MQDQRHSQVCALKSATWQLRLQDLRLLLTARRGSHAIACTALRIVLCCTVAAFASIANHQVIMAAASLCLAALFIYKTAD
jgi:hypothetical protein